MQVKTLIAQAFVFATLAAAAPATRSTAAQISAIPAPQITVIPATNGDARRDLGGLGLNFSSLINEINKLVEPENAGEE
jgi:hypothetical protein